MSMTIPDDDDDIEMEELEGLIHVNPFAETKQKLTQGSAKYKGHHTSVLSSYRNKSNLIKIVAFVIVLILFGKEFRTKDTNNLQANNADQSDKIDGESTDKLITIPKTTNDIIEEPTIVEEQEETTEEDINSKERWGHWKFYDGGAEIRPKEDYCANYPNRDIPGSQFPDDSWQIDAVYVNHFLNEGIELVKRVQEAILTEYGHGKTKNMSPKDLVLRRKMFELTMIDDAIDDNENRVKPEKPNNAGITTKSSYDGLVKRLLHAMITNDSFTVVLGGHSAAAGHGNHFKQSYVMQFYYVMEPVFKRLGMNLIVRNLAQGGLGTMQSALGSKDIYGSEIDVIVWDSSMTEKKDASYDLFARQAILGGNRVPFLYHGHFHPLIDLHDKDGADVLYMGDGSLGIPTTIDKEQVLTLPWAVRYMKCDEQCKDLCDISVKYRTQCWVDRDDVIPPTKQKDSVGFQVSLHPGFRHHQLLGRLMAFVMLEALEDALSIWSEETIIGGHPLQDKFWHVSDYYKTIKNKLQNHSSYCGEDNKYFPARVCSTALNGRTEFTPRANPAETSIMSIVRPAGPNQYLPQYAQTLLYDGPDVPNPAMQLPADENVIDVHAIAGYRRSLINMTHLDDDHRSMNKHSHNKSNEGIIPGLGWSLDPEIPPGNCDGTYDAICKRTNTSDCLLSGHMDGRGGLFGDSFSGWLVMDLPNLNQGLIILKLETWHENRNKQTEGWTSENNNRYLKDDNKLCKDFKFHYAINGNIITLNREEYLEQSTHPERVVELLTILDDENFGEFESVEVGIRLSGCGRSNSFKLTHIYWA